MPSLRKRYREPDQFPSPAPDATMVEQTAAVVEPDAPVVADAPASPASVEPAAERADESEMQKRLREMEAAEQAQREMQARIAAQFVSEPKPPPQPPKLSERDLEFLGARPGVEKDPRLAIIANAFAATLQYGSDDFYAAMSNAFPIERYRRVEPEAAASEPQRATEPSKPMPAAAPPRPAAPGPQHYSAPPAREVPSMSSGRPTSSHSVRLSAQQREAAHFSRPDLPPLEAETLYARNVLKMEALKASGAISDDEG